MCGRSRHTEYTHLKWEGMHNVSVKHCFLSFKLSPNQDVQHSRVEHARLHHWQYIIKNNIYHPKKNTNTVSFLAYVLITKLCFEKDQIM